MFSLFFSLSWRLQSLKVFKFVFSVICSLWLSGLSNMVRHVPCFSVETSWKTRGCLICFSVPMSPKEDHPISCSQFLWTTSKSSSYSSLALSFKRSQNAQTFRVMFCLFKWAQTYQAALYDFCLNESKKKILVDNVFCFSGRLQNDEARIAMISLVE